MTTEPLEPCPYCGAPPRQDNAWTNPHAFLCGTWAVGRHGQTAICKWIETKEQAA